MVDLEAPVVEEDPAQEVAEAAATVLTWGEGVVLLWTSPQLLDLQLRHQYQPQFRVSQPSPWQQWKPAHRWTTVGAAYLLL